jgi:hypothetical protein
MCSHVFDVERTQHVFYPDVDGHINELFWRPTDRATREELSPGDGCPGGLGGKVTLVRFFAPAPPELPDVPGGGGNVENVLGPLQSEDMTGHPLAERVSVSPTKKPGEQAYRA